MSHWGLYIIRVIGKGYIFTTRRVTRISRLGYQKQENMEKRVSNSQIPRTGPRSTIRGKGRKFGSDTPARAWCARAVHPRLGCLSESDLRGWCTGLNETYLPGIFMHVLLCCKLFWTICRGFPFGNIFTSVLIIMKVFFAIFLNLEKQIRMSGVDSGDI